MADDFGSLVAAGTAPIVSSVTAGANWAQGQAALDMRRQALAQQQQQHDLMKQEFQAKVAQQFGGDLNEYAEIPDKPDDPGLTAYKKQKKDLLIKTWGSEGANLKSDDELDLMASALKSPEIKQNWGDLWKSMTGKTMDDQGKQSWQRLYDTLGSKTTTSMFKDFTTHEMMTQAMQARVGQQTENRTWQQTKEGQKQYENTVKGIDPMLSGAARASSIIDNLMDPNVPEAQKIKATKQVRSIIANEEARLVTQKSNFGEGTAGDMAIDSFATRAKDLAGKMADEPTDTLSPGFLRQAKALYSDLNKEYMQAHDRSVERLTAPGSGPQPEINAIQSRAKAFRNSWANRLNGWQGTSQEGVQIRGKKSAAPAEEQEAAPSAGGGEAAPPPDVEASARRFKNQLMNLKDPADQKVLKEAAQKRFGSYPNGIIKKYGFE